ncbi:MAG: hypothetical protein ACI84E_000104, partial [Planctomycetota bacterium]
EASKAALKLVRVIGQVLLGSHREDVRVDSEAHGVVPVE